MLVPTHHDRWQDLIASGQILAASDEGHILDDPAGEYGISGSQQLAALRAEER
ncbi:MAG: hypothetical protein JWN96_995 [Mycobacterium sp.]|jgi:hypothetical protein|nr:hypothetical protein [Mycobacterium sp.]